MVGVNHTGPTDRAEADSKRPSNIGLTPKGRNLTGPGAARKGGFIPHNSKEKNVEQKNLTDKFEIIKALEGREVKAPSGAWNLVKDGRIHTGFGAWLLTRFSEPELKAMLATSREATNENNA